ncbi:ABC transporter substrate-binding protein [candidate division KSB3 bacterium]|uniref:ABC transporter substrate-binding protein n=1 Tax=candidate division KSB3 bacterium TaxID=2044937 RepID=A0A2G6E6E2_9BACT|nr:MAG: ABC transporter substrate-binding protein [candidate division KSB3 bacterium]
MVSSADVTVTSASGDTITFTDEEIGSIAASGEQPFKGKEISITVNTGGPKGGISGPLFEWRDAWEKLTGAKLNIVEIPIAEQFQKVMIDLQTGAGNYDACMPAASWYGDLVTGGFAFSPEAYYGDPRFPQWSRDYLPPALVNLHTWGGKWYGVPNDSDGQVLYFRKDILTDPEWQAEFKEALGYELPVPPKTWDQVYDIANFFNNKDWDRDGEVEKDSGIALHFQVQNQGMYHFVSLSAAYTVLPGESVDKCHNVYWFDPEDMTPLINEPGHVKALEFLYKLFKTGPEAQIAWDLGTAWDYFLRGDAIFTYSWGDVGSLVQDESRSAIKGKLGAAVLPGSYEVYDRCQGKFVTMDEPNVVGNTTGGSWHGVILNSAVEKGVEEVVYHLLAFHATPKISMWNVARGWTGVDPGWTLHYLKEQGGTATIEDFTSQNWDAADVKDYTQAYHDNFFADTVQPYIRIPGGEEFWYKLDEHLNAAMAGQLTPQEALDRAAKDWNEVNERLGMEEQLKFYQESIGYQP